MKKIGTNTGIYIIKNRIDSRVYIGSSKNLYSRTQKHFTALSSNVHHNIHLQRFVNKYTLDSIYFEILEYCEVSELLEKENKYINEYDSIYNGFNLFNATRTELSDFQRNLVSEERKNNQFNKQISVLKDGEVIHTGNIDSILTKFNTDKSSVYKIIKGKRKLHKGFSFREATPEEIEESKNK